ncbi:MAG TPA: hypothetical protein VFW38_07570 [Solirubrobacteraceae bacterium]|nr:hypothetical protein [Solirubrobacteraceae bacterium]
MAGNDPVALRGTSRLTLAISEHYFVVNAPDNDWQVQSAAYFYAVGRQDTGELLAFHWHPCGNSPVTTPHLHVRANIQIGERWLGKVHLPTGFVAIEDIVTLAIRELGAEPLREDWEALIADHTRA